MSFFVSSGTFKLSYSGVVTQLRSHNPFLQHCFLMKRTFQCCFKLLSSWFTVILNSSNKHRIRAVALIWERHLLTFLSQMLRSLEGNAYSSEYGGYVLAVTSYRIFFLLGLCLPITDHVIFSRELLFYPPKNYPFTLTRLFKNLS